MNTSKILNASGRLLLQTHSNKFLSHIDFYVIPITRDYCGLCVSYVCKENNHIGGTIET